MAIQVRANFVFTDEEFEALSFEKKGDIIEDMLNSSEWTTEIFSVELEEVNMDSEHSSEGDE